MNLNDIQHRRDKLEGQAEFFVGDIRRYIKGGRLDLAIEAIDHAEEVARDLIELNKQEEALKNPIV